MFLLLRSPRKIRTTFFPSKLIQNPPKTRNFLPTLLGNSRDKDFHPGKKSGFKKPSSKPQFEGARVPLPLRKLSQTQNESF